MADGTLKILIADDDAGDRKQLRRALKQSGLSFECTETTSVEAAIAACGNCGFDCAIVDYRMPGHDGLHGVVALHHAFLLCQSSWRPARAAKSWQPRL